MAENAICTIIAKNYLAQARCLVDSFLAQHPSGRAFVLLIDHLDGCYDPEQEAFSTVFVEDIGIPHLPAMLLRYSLLELCTAVKPFFLEYLFKQYGYQSLCYFDPDIYFYSPIHEVWHLLDDYQVVLTPHLLGFLDDDHRPSELDILRSGAYNLGFIGLSRHEETERLLHWWQKKLLRDCVAEPEDGLFVDQRWMDLAPSLFSGVHILRDPTYNVAYWNLSQRALESDSQGMHTIDGRPLRFFHFSGYYPDRKDIVSKHQDRFTFENCPQLKPLFSEYRDCLLAHGYETARHWPYSHSSLGDVHMPDIARRVWRRLADSDPDWDPYATTPDAGFADRVLSWLNEPVDDPAPGQPIITRLAWGLYQSRPDLQPAFPDILGRDRRQFSYWFRTRGKIEYALDDVFIRPAAERKGLALPRLRELSVRRAGVWLYYGVTNLLFRLGVGHYLERTLGGKRVGRIRRFFVQPARSISSTQLPESGASTRSQDLRDGQAT